MGLKVNQVAVGGFDDNFSYVLVDSNSRAAVVVDPAGSIDQIQAVLQAEQATLKSIFLTHTHHDHLEGVPEILRLYPNTPVFVHEAGIETLKRLVPDATIETYGEGDELLIGTGKIKILHTPGHIDDAVCIFVPKENNLDGAPAVIAGDTLFVGGCGRTNAENVEKLFSSLKRLKSLPPETIVYSGHDYGDTPTSTIERELKTNRFLLAPDFAAFKKIRLG